MKSARVEFRTTSAALASAATSLRFPFSFLFLVAVLTLLSYRTATVSRVFNYHPFDQIANSHLPDLTFSVSPPPLATTPLNPLPNATTCLLRLASIDVNEKADTSEIQDLLDTNEDSMHRSVVSWRRFHRLDVGNDNSAALLHIRVERFSRLFPDFHRSLRQWSRNRRLQPAVMFELLDLVKRPIDRHRGVVTDQRNKKYRTCAVVGNSGILLKHRDGDLIDGHDLVIRLNNARTNGYDRNVGRKTSLAFINSNILHLCSRREGCRCHSYGPDVPMITYICQPVHFLDYTICNGSYRTPPLLVTDARFDFLCSSLVKYYSLKRFVEKTGKSPEEWDKAHDAKMFHYSSGMQAVMLALGICDQVSIFGFGKSADAKHHYHTGQRSELDLHDYEAEYDLYRDLAERPQVIPFLAHSVVGFKVPPVVIRHSLT